MQSRQVPCTSLLKSQHLLGQAVVSPGIKSSLLIINKFKTNIGLRGGSSSGVGEALAYKRYSLFNLNFEYKKYIAKVQNEVMLVTSGAVVKIM